MHLKNGYKVLYEVIEDSKRVFKASTTGLFEDAENIASYDIGAFKAVYQRGNELFGIDAEGNETALDAFNKIFVEATSNEETPAPTNIEEPTVEPEVPVAPQSEPEVVDPTDEGEEENIEE